MPLTPEYGFAYERLRGEQPGRTLTGLDGSPILAEQVEDGLVRIDANLDSVLSDVSSLVSTAIRRVAITEIQPDSTEFTTTETVLMSVTGTLDASRRYAISFWG